MPDRIPILVDSDANNELDDQHAIAYAAFNSDAFDLVGVTVNNTPLGDGIQGQYNEAKRVLQLCDSFDSVPLFKGADQNYEDIHPFIHDDSFDGKDAVDFIIAEARRERDQPLVVIPVGKLTNIALALDRAPDIKSKIRVVWLGSNYPEEGEYNLVADIPSVNSVLNSSVAFEMVTVRYTQSTGSTAVAVETEFVRQTMPGLGPQVDSVIGRHGGEFTCFGDYSVSLFEHMNSPKRPLFDVVAVAVVKNPSWGERSEMPAPVLEGNSWVDWPDNPHSIAIWENFDKDAILQDFFQSMRNYRLPS